MVRELIVGRTECEDTSEEHAWAVLRTDCGRFRGRRTDGTDKLRSFRPEASESAPRLSLRDGHVSQRQPQHLLNYLKEFEFRRNTRKLDDGQRVSA